MIYSFNCRLAKLLSSRDKKETIIAMAEANEIDQALMDLLKQNIEVSAACPHAVKCPQTSAILQGNACILVVISVLGGTIGWPRGSSQVHGEGDAGLCQVLRTFSASDYVGAPALAWGHASGSTACNAGVRQWQCRRCRSILRRWFDIAGKFLAGFQESSSTFQCGWRERSYHSGEMI